MLTVSADRTKWARDVPQDQDDNAERIIRAPFPDVLSMARAALSRAGIVKAGAAGADSRLTIGSGDKRVGGAVTLQRAFSWAKRWASFPDRYLLWSPFAIAAGLREMKHRKYDAVMSTAPPFTNHIVAAALSRATGVPWLADYRDPFTGNVYWDHTPLQKKLTPVLEKWLLGRSKAVTTVSGPLAIDLEAVLGSKPCGIHVITNGFDPQDFEGTVTQEDAVFSLTYTGMLYGDKRSMGPLLEVLEELISAGVIGPTDVRVRVFGPRSLELENVGLRLAHPEILEIEGVVPRSVSIERQRASTALLNPVWDDPYSAKGYGGKVFEYLGSRRPILAWNPPGGVLEELLAETGAGESVGDREALKAVLVRWLDEYNLTGTLAFKGDPQKVCRYGWDSLSGSFASILDRLVGQTCQSRASE